MLAGGYLQVHRRLAAGLVCVSALACGGDTGPTGPGTAIRILPSPAVVPQSGVLQLNVALLNREGDSLPGVTFDFASSHPAIATVSASGLVTSVGPAGQTTITASTGGLSGQVQAEVPQVATSLALLPSPIEMPRGAAIRVSARVLDAVGAPMTAAPFSFSADPVSLLSVNQEGLVTAADNVGTGSVTATSGSLMKTVTVSIFDGATLRGEIVRTVPIDALPYGVTLGPNGAVYGIGVGGVVIFGQLGSNAMQTAPISGSNTIGIARHPVTGRLYVSGSEADALLEVDPVTRIVTRRWAAPGAQMYDVAISLDGAHVYVAGYDGAVHVIDPSTMTRIRAIPAGGPIVHLLVHPSQPLIYASGFESAREVNLETGAVRTFPHPYAQAAALALAGDRLFIGGETSSIGIVTLSSGAQTTTDIPCRFYDAVAAPDGRTLLATCPLDGKAVILDALTLAVLATIPTGGDPRRIAISRDGTAAVIANNSGWYDHLQ